MRTINIPEVKSLIKKINATLLSSNDIVLRAKQPYYYDHPSVPKALEAFKNIISLYRYHSAKLIHKLGKQPMGSTVGDFSEGTLVHKILCGLTISTLGIAECAECVYKLAAELALAGAGDLLFVSLNLTRSKRGMEQGHLLLITNIKTPPKMPNKELTLVEFIKYLPTQAVIADPFLGECFKPSQPVPERINQYILAYGGEAKMVLCEHYFNFSANVLTQQFIRRVPSILQQLKYHPDIKYEQRFSTSFLQGIQPTDIPILIERLNQSSCLNFCAYNTQDSEVSAVATLENKQQRKAAIELVAMLFTLPEGTVCISRDYNGQHSLVIKNTNMPEIAASLQQHLEHNIISQ